MTWLCIQRKLCFPLYLLYSYKQLWETYATSNGLITRLAKSLHQFTAVPTFLLQFYLNHLLKTNWHNHNLLQVLTAFLLECCVLSLPAHISSAFSKKTSFLFTHLNLFIYCWFFVNSYLKTNKQTKPPTSKLWGEGKILVTYRVPVIFNMFSIEMGTSYKCCFVTCALFQNYESHITLSEWILLLFVSVFSHFHVC